MRDFLAMVAGVLVGIFIMLMILDYIISEARLKGWNECYKRMREIDDPYIESVNAYISGMEKQIKNYEEYTKQLREHIEILEDNHECLRLDVRDSIAEEERLNDYINTLENQIDHLERELAELRGED